jgi:hypothetical protein
MKRPVLGRHQGEGCAHSTTITGPHRVYAIANPKFLTAGP